MCTVYTHVVLVALAVRCRLLLLVHQALGVLQHLLHLDEFSRLRVAVPADFQHLLLPLGELAVVPAHLE